MVPELPWLLVLLICSGSTHTREFISKGPRLPPATWRHGRHDGAKQAGLPERKRDQGLTLLHTIPELLPMGMGDRNSEKPDTSPPNVDPAVDLYKTPPYKFIIPQQQSMKQRKQTGNGTRWLLSKPRGLISITKQHDQKQLDKERIYSPYTFVSLFIEGNQDRHSIKQAGTRRQGP